ncbi:MAG: septum formation initiator family protein [Bryobacterales bacterium]|nr:septum formation initiator family protein [Bryobacterales bacterium]
MLRRTLWLGGLALCGWCVYAVLSGPHGIPMVLEKRRMIRQLEEENATLRRELERKRERIRRLEGDQAELELEIRRRQKLLKKNETAFILPKAAPAGSGSPAR